MSKPLRHLLRLSDLTKNEILAILKKAALFKKQKKYPAAASGRGRVLGLVFEKESTRTRTSFEVGMYKLGGSSIYIDQGSSQLSRGESYADTARVLSGYLDALVMRTFSHQSIEELAVYSRIPVINGLTDSYHPCQLLADLLTVQEEGFHLNKVRVTYVGDGNNMANSWVEASQILGFPLNLACPKPFYPEVMDVIQSQKQIQISSNPVKEVTGSQVVVTDTWFSMGQKVTNQKRKLFDGFQINEKLLGHADRKAIVLHCLPAHREEEITSDVLDGEQSRVFPEAENRLYVQMAVLDFLLS